MGTPAPIKRASFLPEDMKEGSGLFDNVRAILTGGKFTKEAPDNYTADGNPIYGVPTFRIVAEKIDGETDEDYKARINVSQSYSLGAKAGDDFTISEDGDYLIPNNDDVGIRKDCKFGTLTASMFGEGVPKTIMGDFAWSKVMGLDGQWKRIADKERTFAEEKSARKGQKSKFPPSTLCLVKLYAMPGEVAVSKPNGRTADVAVAATPATPAATSAAAIVDSGDLDADTTTVLEAVLTDKKKPIQRSQLTLLLSRKAKAGNHPQYNAIAKRGAEEAFLVELADAGFVVYDPAANPQVVSLPAAA